MRIIKRVLMAMILMVVVMMGMMFVYTTMDRKIDYDVDIAGIEIPKYRTVELSHAQTHSDETSLPFTAGAAIDVDGDGVQELFIGGGHLQQDVLYKYTNGEFVEVPQGGGIQKPEGASTTLGALVLDADRDGDEDMIVTRPDGVWLYSNEDGSFSGTILDANIDDDTTPMSVSVADLNADGHFDMYVSGYIRNDLVEGLNIFNKEGYGGRSVLFINNGDNTFVDETEGRGLEYRHNTFQSAFIDFDNDGDLDLVVAHDTGQVKTWENTGEGSFVNLPNPNSTVFSYPMGIAIADYDNNGFVDFMFSNVGSTPPHFMVKGDLQDNQQHHWKWLLFQNQGGLKFADAAEDAKLADYEFSWGTVFEDLNLDGREDLVVSENFVTAPFHKVPFMRLPGRLFVQNQSGEFAEVGGQAGVVNKRYSISPVTADFNGDGRPDIVHINIAGKSQAFLSESGGPNGFLKVKLPRDVSSIGAMVTVTLDDGSQIHKPYVSGEGLVADSSNIIIVGLGAKSATAIDVAYIGRETKQLTGTFRDTTIDVESAQQ